MTGTTTAWPWWIAGPALGLFVPALLLLGNKQFGVSSSFRHLCAACLPANVPFFRYDWKRTGAWSLVFLAGILVGGWIASPAVVVPPEVFNWEALLTVRGVAFMIVGGFLVGFGSAYAGGCTSGHAISGLANFQPASAIAVASFFMTGALTSRFIIPLLMRLP